MGDGAPLTADDLKDLADRLRAHALALPETREDFPWGHSAFKVRDKTFLFLHLDAAALGLSVKLPVSREMALELPGTAPTGYGLGKAGWVSLRLAPGDAPPLFERLTRWVEESYRAVAPKRLGRNL